MKEVKFKFEINFKMVEGTYEKICDIGKGSFGVVSKIKRVSDG
jgi:hypothetical protein